MEQSVLNSLYKSHQESTLFGRYIHSEHIQPLLDKWSNKIDVEEIGRSVNNLPINSITIGKGSKKVLMWSQMHGNESTTTKALFDLLSAFEDVILSGIFQNCTLKIIAILNPDGAKAYTRINANAVDLNRDAQDLSQPESKVLLACFNNFKPDFCFNLHGQRTLFSAGNTNKIATLSFLSPAEDEVRTITDTRKKAMEVIVAINNSLQFDLPNQIGRYDDGFNINCVGDSFQSLNAPTLLFEAGHYADDYNREEVRRFIFKSLIVALDYISKEEVTGNQYKDYFKIPENGKLFYDIIIRNAKFDDKLLDIGINYEEVLKDNTIVFQPIVLEIKDLSDFFGHKVVNANKHTVLNLNKEEINIGSANDFVMINNEKSSLKL